MEDESEIKQRILENIEEDVTCGLSKKVTNMPVSYTHLDVYKRQKLDFINLLAVVPVRP